VRYKVNAVNDEASLYIKVHKYEAGSVELLHMYISDGSRFL